MQAHLAFAHHDVVRRIDLDLRRQTLRREIVWIRTIGVRHESQPVRSRHHAQTAVLSRSLRQSQPDRRYERLLDAFRDAVLMPADERSALTELVK